MNNSLKFLVFIILTSNTLFAFDYIETGVLWLTQKDLNAPLWFHNASPITSINSNAQIQSEAQPYLMFENHNKVFNGEYITSFDETQKLSFQYFQKKYGIEFFYRPSYEFKNPYQLNFPRESTFVSEAGISPHYQYDINEKNLIDFSYAISYKKVDNDILKDTYNGFDRSGEIHRLQSNYKNEYFNLANSIFASRNMGDFQNFKGYDFKISTMYPYQNIQLYASAYIKHEVFNIANPLFGYKEINTMGKVSFSGEYDFPSNYYISCGISSQRQWSSIEFYKAYSNIVSIGFGKNF